MEKERERGSSEGSVAVRGEEGGQETDDQACLPVLFSSPLPPAPKAPLPCLLSSLFLTLAPPRAALRLSCLGLLLPILARAVGLF